MLIVFHCYQVNYSTLKPGFNHCISEVIPLKATVPCSCETQRRNRVPGLEKVKVEYNNMVLKLHFFISFAFTKVNESSCRSAGKN